MTGKTHSATGFFAGLIISNSGYAFRWSSAADTVQCCKDPGMQFPHRRNYGQAVEIGHVLWHWLSWIIGIISDSIQVYQNIAEKIRKEGDENEKYQLF